ncbi:protein arginine kinase [Desulfonispora thiosulfatigenes DSM 11270]|uniref:Protein-arginine kinase n=1 Tax=Desulfonispora thiosulfatigenes DSM 11270 TaxID=656914 RepID=A0A1W1UTN7_DESTI|nr:protein arginine kinase [Desulfonispora thiosulfatigenes DSM 11270]
MLIKNLIEDTHSFWTEGSGNFPEIVLSSRIRLARNLEEFLFNTSNKENSKGVLKTIKDATSNIESLEFFNLEIFNDLERKVLVEKHLISPGHGHNPQNKGILVNKEGSVSIMVNEEDHLRIQCFGSGLVLKDLWQKCTELDDLLEEKLNFAFNEKYGYLTTCPTNLGTGLRVSVMMHLPALVLTRQTNLILRQLSQVGVAVRGIFGEGTEALGNLFQISNQISLGQSEEEIVANVNLIVKRLVDQEQKAREYLLNKSGLLIEDKAKRAYGILTNAKIISSEEAFSLISDLRLGKTLGMVENLEIKPINELFLLCQPAYLQIISGKEMTAQERDIKRAEIFKEILQR